MTPFKPEKTEKCNRCNKLIDPTFQHIALAMLQHDRWLEKAWVYYHLKCFEEMAGTEQTDILRAQWSKLAKKPLKEEDAQPAQQERRKATLGKF